jgi:hypothetical protein
MRARGMFLVTLPLIWVASAAGQVTTAGSLAEWGRSMDLDPRITRELLRFQEGGRTLNTAQAGAFIGEIRARVFSSAERQVALLQSGECNPFVEVSIGELDSLSVPRGVKEEREAWGEFENSVIRTEMVACLKTDVTDPAEVLRLYVSPEFRMAAEGRIKEMWEDQEGQCMETKGVLSLVDPTRVCNRTREYFGDQVAAQHSQVVFNEGRNPFQTVFFKESLKTFVRVPGGMALHYINYVRAGKLGRLERWAGPGQIRGSQEGTVEELQKRLRARSPARAAQFSASKPVGRRGVH